jgi:hypothetical protein
MRYNRDEATVEGQHKYEQLETEGRGGGALM